MYFHGKIRNIGFVSTRLHGTDGVSLETEKWDEVVTRLGYTTFYFAGLCDRPPERSMVVPLAYLHDPRIARLHEKCFGTFVRDPKVTQQIHRITHVLKKSLQDFINRFCLDLLIIENALAIPLNIPFGLALTEVIAETGIPAIGHHHDLYWERQRFIVNCTNDYLRMSFPPSLPSIRHAVINSQAQKDLAYRRGLNASLVPNVFDFSRAAPGIDVYNATIRKDLGLAEDDVFILQPTRVIARKGIEHAIELVARLENEKARLVITHQTKDEGGEYLKRIKSYAALLKVELVIKPELIGTKRGIGPTGRKIYSIWDLYPHADFVTYPSAYEGFGNAFLEAVYFRKPLLVNRYSIYQRDIEHLGFDTITMETYIDDEIVKKVRTVLADEKRRNAMTGLNFELAKKHFSYEVLEQSLRTMLLFFEGHS